MEGNEKHTQIKIFYLSKWPTLAFQARVSSKHCTSVSVFKEQT